MTGGPATSHRIFVQIAGYRDPDLASTVANVIEAAADASRLRFGICHQYDDATADLLAEHADDPRFRIDAVPWSRSRGVGWARARANRRYQGEEWFLQIDAHTRLAEGWDESLVAQARAVPSERPLLSTYPTPFEVGDDGREHRHRPPAHPLRIGLRAVLPDGSTEQLMDERPDATAPGRQFLLAAGFLFGPGRFVRDVPYDPCWYFNGEEVALALRAYTHGYDVFFPWPTVAWHRYRHGRPLHWEDRRAREVEALTAASTARVAALFNGDAESLGRHGCGERRTVGAFEAASGVRLPPLAPPPLADVGAGPRPVPRALRYDEPTAPGLRSATPPPDHDPAQLQVFGPFNSGTGLMFNLLQALTRRGPRWHYCFHKHSLPPRLRWERGCIWPPDGDGPDAALLDTTLLVGMVRLPEFWLSSMVRAPYEVDFLDTSSTHPSARLRSRIRWREREFDDLAEMWNEIYRAYRDHFEPHGVAYVRLEDLVADPHRVVDDVGRLVRLRDDLDRHDTIETVRREPAKVHTTPCFAGEEARARYDLGNLGHLWSRADLAHIGTRIDADLRRRFGYPTIGSAPRTVATR